MGASLGDDAARGFGGGGSPLDRRRFLKLGGAAALAAGGAALTGAAPGSAAAVLHGLGQAPRAARGRLAPRGTINVALQSDPLSLDPVQYNTPTTQLVYTAVVEPLYHYDQHANLVPWLAAARPTVNSSFTRFEVPLRRGVRFHNGKPLTSADVKFTAEQIVNPKNSSNQSGPLASLIGVETPDPYTVVFHLKSETRYFAQAALVPALYIVPADLGYVPGKTYASRIVGTGPFKFVDWVHGQEITLERFDHYWQAGLPLLKGVRFPIIPTIEAQVAEVVSGELQILPSLPPLDAGLVRSRGARLYAPRVTFGLDWLWPNWSPGHPTSNADLRQAITWAINRKRIVNEIYRGLGSPTATLPANGTLGYNAKIGEQTIPPEGDPVKAKQFLAAAGGPPKAPLVLINTTAVENGAAESQLVQQDLAAIGIDVTIETQGFAASVQTLIAGEYDLFLLAEGSLVPPVQGQYLDVPGEVLNYNHVDDPKLTALANDAANNSAVVPALQRQMLSVVPQIVLAAYPPLYALHKSVNGFSATLGSYDMTGLVRTSLA